VASVYLVIVDDRRTDTEPEVFATSDAAIEYARKVAGDHAEDLADLRESQDEDCLLRVSWSGEARVYVLEKTVRDGSE
jgi:hypothetical protein